MRRWGTERVVGLHDPRVNEHHLESTGLPADSRLRLLGCNPRSVSISERYRHYLTRGWQHLLPHTGRADNLQKIGNLLGDFDLVALQEADGGSLRSGYVVESSRTPWHSSAPSPTGINNSIATSDDSASTAMVCSAACARGRLKITRCRGPRVAERYQCAFGEGPEALVVVAMIWRWALACAACNWPTFAS